MGILVRAATHAKSRRDFDRRLYPCALARDPRKPLPGDRLKSSRGGIATHRNHTVKARAAEGFSSEALVVSPVARHGRRREPGPNCIWKINAQRVPPPRSTGLAPTPLPLLAAFFQGKCWSGINHQISYRASDETEPATTPTARHGSGTKTAPSAERADGRLHRSAPQPR
jgi:hypothetical protein